MHKTCLPKNLEPESNTDQNKCRTCLKPIMDGLEAAVRQPKMQPNKVTVKIRQISQDKKKKEEVVNEMMQKAQPVAFGVSGLGLAATGIRHPYQSEQDGLINAKKQPQQRGALMKPPMPNRPKPMSLLLSNQEEADDSFNIAGTQIGALGKENVFKDSQSVQENDRSTNLNSTINSGLKISQRHSAKPGGAMFPPRPTKTKLSKDMSTFRNIDFAATGLGAGSLA